MFPQVPAANARRVMGALELHPWSTFEVCVCVCLYFTIPQSISYMCLACFLSDTALSTSCLAGDDSLIEKLMTFDYS